MKKIFYILLTAFFSLTGYFSVVRLIEKPDLPFEYYSNSSGVFAEDPDKLVNRILTFDGISVNSDFQLEFVIDRYQTGQTVSLTYIDKSEKEIISNIVLVPYYENISFIAISTFIGFVFLIMGFFVAMKKTENTQALLLYWVLTLYGLATITSPGYYNINNDWIGYAIRSLHAISYTIGSLFFILFIISFPVNRLNEKKVFVILNYVLALAVTLFPVISQHISAINHSNGALFEKSWLCVLSFLVYALITGTYFFIKDFRAIKNKEDRKKREWIIWGLIVGVSPYLFFWVIPRIIGFKTLINEEYLLIFLIIIPVSFVTSVIKYHVLDIELVIKRSFVYSLLSIIIIIVYLLLIYILSILFSFVIGPEQRFFNLLAVLITALLFNPLKERLNLIADRIFYREKYKTDTALLKFTAGIKNWITISTIGDFVSKFINELIPIKSFALAVKTGNNGNFRIINNNVKGLENSVFYELYGNGKTNIKLFGKQLSIETGTEFNNSAEDILKHFNISICVPLINKSNITIGFILMGDKLSGLRYSHKDTDLLLAIADNTSIAIESVQMQEKLMIEEMELAKLEELNRLKSFYVASVSHDLKTPLTSISMFAELLKDMSKLNKKQLAEYTDIIIGESNRLSRLIENVLDFAKIENGSKNYELKPVNFNKIVTDVLRLLEYDIGIKQFKLNSCICSEILTIDADPDAMKSAIINLLSNSIKFSTEKKSIDIKLFRYDNSAVLEISDNGIGIPKSELNDIFNPFYRSDSVKNKKIKGTGLGLSIVKHIMVAHNGNIEIESEIGKGTNIKLIIPVITNV